LLLLSFRGQRMFSDRPTAPKGSPSLSDAEAQLVGHEVAGEVEDAAASFSLGGLLVPSVPERGIAPSDGILPAPMANCPTLTPNPPVDTDGDRFPDDLTISFTLPDCSFAPTGRSRSRSRDRFNITPVVYRFRHPRVFDNLDHKFTGDAGATSESKLNGARQVLAVRRLRPPRHHDGGRHGQRPRCGTAGESVGSSRSPRMRDTRSTACGACQRNLTVDGT